ncbi:hypothetical protein HBI56_157800 [Parastagonospora nodorum]|uniref:Uncharacterized protein n=1 Tax=Phaeosphaeria nodorum (strain SN15 / ATCC MYA-4574 / FGSC 10173) TaxID=321614 RepID=A0A7U2ET10_PHANO|nr:hypothetical protein HBH56_188540 [Parastagonospora nodorum]QRC92252.1 hypothetical protein JI435_023940 [Parastagonospora nodorum SN15]KAH3925071.1 hypothetical protein HBH54_184350 [Parastagonospora nodorum]KAH3954411.1 hypothetical protein HBH53_023700 [Parastagonospora nodorum]KAH3963867.1 hypothetical protein HBH51_163530 [Parastagonospora nodorum]
MRTMTGATAPLDGMLSCMVWEDIALFSLDQKNLLLGSWMSEIVGMLLACFRQAHILHSLPRYIPSGPD